MTEAYQLGRRLSAGTMGDVYEASHPRLPGRYAIKLFKATFAGDAEALRAFRAEVEAISALRHPNVAQVVEVGTMPDGTPFVVMEMLEGTSLAARLDGRPMTVADVLPVVRGVAAALQSGHGRGVVHREIRPENVFLAVAEGHDRGFVKVLNFGVSRLRGGGAEGPGHAPARYLSPEQAQGRADVDGRADQFALAAITYRMLAGVDAFQGDDAIAILYHVVHEAPRPLGQMTRLSARLEAVVHRGLNKAPGDRFESVLAFARALEEAATETVAGFPDRTVQSALPRRPTPAPLAVVEVEPPRPPTRYHSEIIEDGPTALADGGGPLLGDDPVLAQEPLDQIDREAPPPLDDLDDGRLRVPRRRAPAVTAGLTALLVILVAALWQGWRPPYVGSYVGPYVDKVRAAIRPSESEQATHAPAPSPTVVATPEAVAEPSPAPAPAPPAPAPPVPATEGAPDPGAVGTAAVPGASPPDGNLGANGEPKADESPTLAGPAPAPEEQMGPDGRRGVDSRAAQLPAEASKPVAADDAKGASAQKEAKPRRRPRPREAPMVWSPEEQRLVPAE